MTVRRPADLLDLDAHAITVRASTIAPRPLDAVWPGVLWAGKPVLVAGDPGLGKSMLTCSIAARVSTGDPWPCSTERRDPADVVMLSAEDDPEDTIVPRLMAAGADLERITFVRGVREITEDGTRERWLTLDRHLDQLGGVLALKPDARLVIIDPLSAYLGGNTDSHNEGDVRAVLAGLADLAAYHRVAILCIRHMRKSDSATSQGKIIGSIAFVAAARAAYVVVRDPDDEDVRLFVCAKNNLAPDTAGYRYRIEATADGIPYVVWDDEQETRTADELLGSGGPKRDKVDDAETWLLDMLRDGPVRSTELFALAEMRGLSRRTVERARQRLGTVIAERETIPGRGRVGPWQWRLASPPSSSPPSPASQIGGLGGVSQASEKPRNLPSPESQAATPPHIGEGGGVTSEEVPF